MDRRYCAAKSHKPKSYLQPSQYLLSRIVFSEVKREHPQSGSNYISLVKVEHWSLLSQGRILSAFELFHYQKPK